MIIPHTAEEIRAMSQFELAQLYRFAPIGCPVFCDLALTSVFDECFKGWNPTLSKAVGWEG
jgi:hypothetical protein